MVEHNVTITLDDYHRWLGELYVKVCELNKALQAVNHPRSSRRREVTHKPPAEST